MLLKRYTSLARGTRPSTVLTTDHVRVDMLSTSVSETPVEASVLVMLDIKMQRKISWATVWAC
jgi:hypothetical protein